MLQNVRLLPLDVNNEEHLDLMFKTRTHPDVIPLLTMKPPTSFETHVAYLKGVNPLLKEFYIVKANDELSGYCQATIGQNEVEFGWTLHPNFWNKGIGTAAVKELVLLSFKNHPQENVRKLLVKKNNLRAITVYEKCGFKISKEGLNQNEWEMVYSNVY